MVIDFLLMDTPSRGGFLCVIYDKVGFRGLIDGDGSFGGHGGVVNSSKTHPESRVKRGVVTHFSPNHIGEPSQIPTLRFLYE